jgi:hypothetical protein
MIDHTALESQMSGIPQRFTTRRLELSVCEESCRCQKGDQACENCSLFEAPSSCKTVDGTVSPKGWCMVNAKKPG